MLYSLNYKNSFPLFFYDDKYYNESFCFLGGMLAKYLDQKLKKCFYKLNNQMELSLYEIVRVLQESSLSLLSEFFFICDFAVVVNLILSMAWSMDYHFMFLKLKKGFIYISILIVSIVFIKNLK